MTDKKPRISVISPHFDGHVEIGRLDCRDGVFSFFGSSGDRVVPTHVEVGHGYTRASGKLKAINQVEADGDRIELNPNAALNRFDWLFAIDTNVKKQEGSVLGVSVSILAYVQISGPRTDESGVHQDWSVRVVPQAAFVFRNPRINPELIGWRELFNRIQDSGAIHKSDRIGVIVDSELKKISAYNQRAEPILGEHYLPEGFELLYASADVGMEYPHNKLLRFCDRTSTRIFDHIVKHKEVIGKMQVVETPYIDGFTTVPSQLVFQLSGYAT